MSYSSVVASSSPQLWYRGVPDDSVVDYSVGTDQGAIEVQASATSRKSFTGVAADGGSFYVGQNTGWSGASLTTYPSQGTIEFWVYLGSDLPILTAAGAGLGINFAHNVNSIATAQTITWTATALWVWNHTGGTNSDTSSTTITAGAWHHVMLVYNVAGTLAWYIDGSAQPHTGTNNIPARTGVVTFQWTGGNRVGPTWFAELAWYSSQLTSSDATAHAGAADSTGRPRWVRGVASTCS